MLGVILLRSGRTIPKTRIFCLRLHSIATVGISTIMRPGSTISNQDVTIPILVGLLTRMDMFQRVKAYLDTICTNDKKRKLQIGGMLL